MKVLIISLFPIIVFFFNSKIANILNLFDKPDKKRKLHKEATPLTGGLILFIPFIIINIFDYFKIFNNEISNFDIFILIGGTLFFIIGYIDDKINISANYKLILFILIIIFLLLFDKNLLIKNITFSFLNLKFSLNSFSFLWTIICFLLFLNAINMFDGINLQVGIYSLICITYLYFSSSYFSELNLLMIISLIIFLILNKRSKSFLGNSGSYFLGFLISALFIKSYNLESVLFVEEIVLIMIIPGIDLIRLFFLRILKKRHPFSPDRNHIHHYLLQKYNLNTAVLIIVTLVTIPLFLAKITGEYMIFLILQFFMYFILLRFLKKN